MRLGVGHRGLSNRKARCATCHRATRESLVTRQRFAAEFPPSRQSVSFRKADQPETPRRISGFGGHTVRTASGGSSFLRGGYCLRPHLWPATRMKLLRTSLGRGREGCKAV